MMPAPDHFAPGWHPDLERRALDQFSAAGHQFRAVAELGDDRPLPKAFSLAKFRQWPYDQGQVGSCFANAAAQLGQIDLAVLNTAGAFQLSRHMVWYQGRKLDGSLGSWGDGGSVTNAVRGISSLDGGTGCCHESLCPYQPSHSALEQVPSEAAFADAANYKFTAVATLPLGGDLKRSIFNGRPGAIGIWWPFGWDSAVDQTGRVTGIGRGTYGHALTVIGWHDDWDGAAWWQIENSHGPIYHPVPPDVAQEIEGYAPATLGKTYDFWTRDDWLREVMGYGNSELLAAAGPDGWRKREVDFEAAGWVPIFT